MDKLKNILKSDTPAGDQPTSNSGKLAGQGSHFPGKEQASTTGTTVTGTTPQTRGPADVSAAPTSSTAAATTVGPEQGGSAHIGTTSAPTTQSTASNPVSPDQGTRSANTYTISNPDPSKRETTEGSGSAAIGQTSTYSTSHLSQGNPTSSIVDPASSDPLTYKKPEAGTNTAEAGVGAGAAATAASLAFTQGEERRKTGMAGSENPYRTDQLDPRVDGLSKASAERATSTIPTTSSTTTTGRDTALGAGTGAGLASAGAATAFSGSTHQEEAPPPSSLTTSVDPTNRSAEYQASTNLKGLDSDKGVTTETPSQADSSSQSMVGRVLGAVGLGGVAGALGAGTTSSSTAVAETPEQPTTTTGLETYTAPTQQGPPTTHHRKESIPTTAYPSATFDSPRAINPPVGGAGSPVIHGDKEDHAGRNVAVGVATGGAAAGAAAIGSHEYEKSRALGDSTTGQPSSGLSSIHHATTIGDNTTSTSLGAGTLPNSEASATGVTSATTGTAPVTTGLTSSNVGSTPPTAAAAPTAAVPTSTSVASTPAVVETKTTTPATGTTGVEKAVAPSTIGSTKEADTEEHIARDAAIGAGAAGAGAYGAHEYSKREAEKADAEAARERAAHDKELARQKAEQEKELEKQHKAEEKAAAKEERKHEKEEQKHQKELEKEEKKHQKELEKEKQHEAEKAALAERREKEREQARLAKEREEAEEERRNRQEKERLLGAAGAGAAAGATGAEVTKDDEEKEKKPNIFKRIFKRRKNKDTGEEEEYESDEEVKNKPAKDNYGAAVYEPGLVYDQSGHAPKDTAEPVSRSTDHAPTKYEEQSGGIPKPSYNPFSKDRPEPEEPATASSTVGQSVIAPTSSVATHGTSKEAITGLPYDPSKDPEAAARLSGHTHGEGIGTFDKRDASIAATAAPAAVGAAAATSAHSQPTAHSGLESTGTRSAQPVEAVTGTTDPASTHGKSIAPSTLESSGTHTQQPTPAVTGLPDPKDAARYSGSTAPTAGHTSEHTGEFHPNTNFTLGEIQESHGIGEKIKEALHIGGHKKEDE